MHSWPNLVILGVLLAGLVISWKLNIPSPNRLPWLVWAPDVALVAWASYRVSKDDWSVAVIAAIVLPIWFARTYPVWRARNEDDPPVK